MCRWNHRQRQGASFMLFVKLDWLDADFSTPLALQSSLLQALIGEMKRESGSVVFGGTTAYAAQAPWVQNATVRDNILFGKDYDDERFENIIHVRLRLASLLPCIGSSLTVHYVHRPALSRPISTFFPTDSRPRLERRASTSVEDRRLESVLPEPSTLAPTLSSSMTLSRPSTLACPSTSSRSAF